MLVAYTMPFSDCQLTVIFTISSIHAEFISFHFAGFYLVRLMLANNVLCLLRWPVRGRWVGPLIEWGH